MDGGQESLLTAEDYAPLKPKKGPIKIRTLTPAAFLKERKQEEEEDQAGIEITEHEGENDQKSEKKFAPEEEKAYQILVSLKELVENELFYWKNFPIQLPPSSFEKGSVVVRWSQLFSSPPSYQAELDTLAGRDQGTAVYLTPSQLQQARELGSFDVPSPSFPGRFHRWKLSPLLQVGKKPIKERYSNSLATSLTPIVVWLPEKVWSGRDSIKSSLKTIFTSLLDIPSILIGLPEYFTPCMRGEVERAAKKHVMDGLERVPKEGEQTDNPIVEGIWRVPESDMVLDYRFLVDPNSSTIHNILSRLEQQQLDAWEKAKVQKKIQCSMRLENLSTEKMQELLVQDFGPSGLELMQSLPKGETEPEPEPGKLTQNQTEILAARILAKQRMEEYFVMILKDQELDLLIPGIGKRVVEFLRAANVILREYHLDNEQQKSELDEYEAQLKRDYPIRGRIQPWVYKWVELERPKIAKRHKHTPMQNAIVKLKEGGFLTEFYLLTKYQEFFATKKKETKANLKRRKVPRKTFTFHNQIWFPKNWIITKDNDGVYRYQDYTVTKMTTGWPLWRWCKSVFNTWSIYKYGTIACFYLFLNGAYGLKSLILPWRFYPDYTLNRDTGQVETDTKSGKETLISNLISLWSNIFKARAAFEAARDDSFLGKSFIRIFHRIWHYLIKGLLGTAFLIAFRTVMSLFCSALFFVLFLTSPAWSIALGVLSHLWDLLIWETPSSLGYILYQILFPGLGRIIMNLLAIAIFPIISLTVLGYASVRDGVRYAYDFLLFHGLIKYKAKIPASDGFLVKRISGPGSRSQYCYLIPSDVALLALQAKIEGVDLDSRVKYLSNLIDEPNRVLRATYSKYFSPLGANLANHHHIVKELEKKTQNLREDLRTAVDKYRESHSVQLIESDERFVTQLTRQTQQQLEVTIERGMRLVELYYTKRIFPSFPTTSDYNRFWSNKNLLEGDWMGLTMQLLKEIFGDTFLIPLDDEEGSEEEFFLKVEDPSARSVARHLLDSCPVPDPLETFKVKSVLKKTNVNDTFPIQLFSSSTATSSSTNLEPVRLVENTFLFRAQVITIVPGPDGEGLKISISGCKDPELRCNSVFLQIEGAEVWQAVEKLGGRAALSVVNLFHPFAFRQEDLNLHLETFNHSRRDVHMSLFLGLRGQIKFKHITVVNSVKKFLEQNGDCSLTLKILLGNGLGLPEDELVVVKLKVSEFLHALETRENLLKVEGKKNI